MINRIIVILLFFVISLGQLNAQNLPAKGGPIYNIPGLSDLSDDTKLKIKYGTIGFFIPWTLFVGIKAWDWKINHAFFFSREGWFAEDTAFAGADKMGHFFAHYQLERAFFTLFNHLDNNKLRNTRDAVLLTSTIGLLIEIGDGFSATYGFSMEDLIIDYVGVLLGATLDNFPVASGFISFTAEYNPTDEFMEYYDDTIHPNMIFTSVNDYSGWKYMLNFKLSGFRNVGVELPAFMNYMQLNVGYFSYGYSEYDYFEKSNSRNLFFGMSLNSMEVVNDIARDRDSNYYKASQTILSIYHPPLGYKYIIRDKRKRSDSETLYDVGLINGEGNDK